MPEQMQSRLGQDDLVGQTVSGRYEVFAKLGQGGMGVVYAARQAPLGRTVAIKVLLKEMTADPVAASRFEKEALAISRLSHPNIVTIFDFGSTDAGHKFIAMEFLDGKSLREIVARESPLSPKRTTRILMYMARALADAHRQEIIHRRSHLEFLHPESQTFTCSPTTKFSFRISDPSATVIVSLASR